MEEELLNQLGMAAMQRDNPDWFKNSGAVFSNFGILMPNGVYIELEERYIHNTIRRLPTAGNKVYFMVKRLRRYVSKNAF